jgi:hypothetical protein
MNKFEQRMHAFSRAKAEYDLRYVEMVEAGGDCEAIDHLCDAQTEAMDVLLLTPAEEAWQLNHKMRVILAEDAVNNYHLAKPILALLADDVRRLTMGVAA